MMPIRNLVAASIVFAPLSIAARADLITVLAADTLIVNHNDVLIAGFTPELTTADVDAALENSMRFSFRPISGNVSALVSGNMLPLYPAEPFQTVSLCYDGGLDQLGTTIDASRGWIEPFFDLATGFVGPATLSTSDLNIESIPDNGYGYVGYATSDLTMFGYMQIQRLSLYEWRLVGYRYDNSGAPVTVENLIPAPTTLAALALLAFPRKRRRASGATSSRHAS